MAKFQQKASQLLPPPATARADGDAQDVSTGVTDTRGGAVQTAPLQPSPPRSWFERTRTRLNITDPDQIVEFSHSPSNVRVRLSRGTEFCLMKASF